MSLLSLGTLPLAGIARVLVGPLGSSQPFFLSKQQIDFYSPFLRNFMEEHPHSETIPLPNDDPTAFRVLTEWMHRGCDNSAPETCHQSGADLEKMIETEDENGIRLAFKVWVLTDRLEGPCLVLRDLCMRYLYEKYTTPQPETGSMATTRAIACYVFDRAEDSSLLPQFVCACLDRDGMEEKSVTAGVCTWAFVLKRFSWLRAKPWLKTVVKGPKGYSRKVHSVKLREVEVYMGGLGDVHPL